MKTDSQKCIFVIDDDKDLLKLIEIRLVRDGYQVKTLLNGSNLLDELNSQRPDLVLMDINMPHISGNALCKILKHNASTECIPIVIFSGNENAATISAACGANGFIPKPSDPGVLGREIQKYLNS